MGCGKIKLAHMHENHYKTNSVCIEGSFYVDLQDNLPMQAKGGFCKILKISGMPEKPKSHTNKRAIKHANLKKVFTQVLNSQSNQSDITSLQESCREPLSELLAIPSLSKAEDSREPDFEKFSDLEEDRIHRGASETYGNNISNDRKEEINTQNTKTNKQKILTPNVPLITIAIQLADHTNQLINEQPYDLQGHCPISPQPAPIPSNFSNLHIKSEADSLFSYEEDVPNFSQESKTSSDIKPSHPADLRLYHKTEESSVSVVVCISPPLIPDSAISRSDTDSGQTVPNIFQVEDSIQSEEELISPGE